MESRRELQRQLAEAQERLAQQEHVQSLYAPYLGLAQALRSNFDAAEQSLRRNEESPTLQALADLAVGAGVRDLFNDKVIHRGNLQVLLAMAVLIFEPEELKNLVRKEITEFRRLDVARSLDVRRPADAIEAYRTMAGETAVAATLEEWMRNNTLLLSQSLTPAELKSFVRQYNYLPTDQLPFGAQFELGLSNKARNHNKKRPDRTIHGTVIDYSGQAMVNVVDDEIDRGNSSYYDGYSSHSSAIADNTVVRFGSNLIAGPSAKTFQPSIFGNSAVACQLAGGKISTPLDNVEALYVKVNDLLVLDVRPNSK